MEWTLKWPEAPGYYWFYGWMAWARHREPKLCIVETHQARDHVVHVHRGQILYQGKDGSYGMWSLIEMPELPPLPPEDMAVSTHTGEE